MSKTQAMPDVILMDMVIPGMDGVTTARAILERHPQVQIMALSSFERGSLVRAALRAGAIGYLLKDAAIDELAEAIRTAHTRRGSLAPAAARALAAEVQRPQGLGSDLTDREREVLVRADSGICASFPAITFE